MSKLRRTLFIASRALPVLVLMVHFAFTLAYAMPVNPVKLEYQKVLNRTIGTYFQQNWRLFAPDPLTETQSISCVV